jgi:lysophospholipase L1-like esterase
MMKSFTTGLSDQPNVRAFARALVAACLVATVIASPARAASLEESSAAEVQMETCPAGRSMLKQQAKLKDFAKRVAERSPLKILAIGSSSTQGIGATAPQYAYPVRFAEELTQRFRTKVEVVNAGVNGETADATLARLEERVTAERFDLVIWQVGTNDAMRGRDEESFRNFLKRGISLVKSRKMDLVLLDQQFFPTMKDPVRYERFVKLIEIAGEEENTPVLSRYRLMKFWGERTPQDLRTMLATDGFHMSNRGYFCLATAMSRAMGDLVLGAPQLANEITPAITASVPRSMMRP